MRAPTYISKDRHGGYLFRIKIPAALLAVFNGKKVLVKSLQTYHRPTALKTARKLAVQTQDFFDQIKMNEQDLHNKRMLAIAKRSIQRGKVDDIISGRVTVKDGSVIYTETSQSLKEIEALGDQNLEIIVNEHTQLEKNIAGYQKKINDLDLQIEHIRKRKLEAEAEKIAGLTSAGSIEHSVQISELLSKLAELQGSLVQAKQVPDSPLISDLWERFKHDKVARGDWPKPKMVKERDGQIRNFIEIIGGDMPASKVDNEIVLQTLTGLASFPTYRNTRWKEKERLADIPLDAPKITKSTQAQRLENLTEFFGYLTKRNIIQQNPFAGYAMDRDSTNYATPTATDIHEWFNLPDDLIENAWQFWIPRVALFCGSRVGEIAQLTPNDIKQDVDTNIHYILINDEYEKTVKSKASIRKVPIHQDLIENGFLTYCNLVKVKGLTSLWPNLKAKGGSLATNVSEYWAKLRDEYNILSEPVNEFGQRKVFHSLRRVIQNKLNNDGVDIIIIQTIVGHEPSLGSSKSYLDEPKPLHLTNAAVQSLKIEGVSWRHPKRLSV